MCFRVPAQRQPLHGRPARKTEAHQLRDLVERLADSVVDGRTEAFVLAQTAHFQELTMPAGDEQQKIRERTIRGEARGEGMTLQMVHRNERNAGGLRDSLAGHQPHQHAADQARPGGRRHAVQRAVSDARLGHRLRHHRVRQLRMRPRGNFRHHAEIRRMLLQLRADHVRQQRRAAILKAQHRRGGLVAGGFDAEDGQGAGHAGRIALTPPP